MAVRKIEDENIDIEGFDIQLDETFGEFRDKGTGRLSRMMKRAY